MLKVAFKEWAAVCGALAEGRQTLILRKGGIAEADGVFRPEHPRFWLYPTYFHEQVAGLKPDARPLHAAALADRPPAQQLRLRHFAEVAAVHFVDAIDTALSLDDLHVWSADTVRQRFHYRTPGLYVLTVRIRTVEAMIELPELPAYAGCKTWVELDTTADEQPSVPVLSDEAFLSIQQVIAQRITPLPR